MHYTLLIPFALFLVGNAENTQGYCPLLGAVFPPSTALSNSSAFSQAKYAMSTTLDKTCRTGEASEDAVFSPEKNSISLQIFSARDPNLFYYSHTAAPIRNASAGVQVVDEDTVFRIGSCSKLWTVLLLLIEAGDASFSEPVVKYIPELRSVAEVDKHNAMKIDDVDAVRWDEVTIGELASQMAGITRDYSILDLAYRSDKMQALGFPQLPESEIPPCGPMEVCNRSDFLEGMMKSHPVVPTASTPVYSNAAFQLLAYALEEMTNKTYPDLLEDDLINPLHLTRSSYDTPKDKYGIIPDSNSSLWEFDLADETPAGGLYSSTRDMATLGRAILSSAVLPPALTRRWMKPATHTSNMRNLVGAPWEIYSISEPRVIDLYTKSGDLGMYSATVNFSPDYDVGFTVLVAGEDPTGTSRNVSNLVVETLIPALDLAAKEETDHRFSGTYALADRNSSITIATDDGPGLKVVDWINGSKDMIEAVSVLFRVGDPSQASVRLYPTGLKSHGQISFRAIIRGPSQIPAEEGPFSLACATWLMVDSQKYGNVGVDEFLFNLDSDGEALSVSPRALREILPRANTDD